MGRTMGSLDDRAYFLLWYRVRLRTYILAATIGWFPLLRPF